MADIASVTSETSDATLADVQREDIVTKSFTKLSEDLANFLSKSEECDVKIEIGKGSEVKEFHAHSPILRARSIYFYKTLSKNSIIDGNTVTSYLFTTLFSSNDRSIILKKENISPKIFRIILDYIYSGIADINVLESSEFLHLFEACEELGIKGFGEYLQGYFLENHDEWIRKNLVDLERFSSKNDTYSGIHNYCLDQLCQNSDLVFKSNDLKSIDKEVLISLMKRDDLIVEEIDLWSTIIQWGRAQNPEICKSDDSHDWSEQEFEELKTIMDGLIPLIRFKWITSAVFYQQVREYKLLFDRDAYEDLMESYLVGSGQKPASSTPKPLQLQLREPKARDRHTSSILTDNKDVIRLISCWIDRKSYKTDHQPHRFKLLYRGSSEDFSYSTFHEKCDSITNTLTIARVQDTKELVGGFNPGSWRTAGRSVNSTYPIYSKKTFIFKIDVNDLEGSIHSRVTDYHNALRHKKDSGPNFCDLVIFNQTLPIRYGQHFYDKGLNLEGRVLDDYEVYRVLSPCNF